MIRVFTDLAGACCETGLVVGPVITSVIRVLTDMLVATMDSGASASRLSLPSLLANGHGVTEVPRERSTTSCLLRPCCCSACCLTGSLLLLGKLLQALPPLMAWN